jgi:NAD(P)-dependent dehydrogenase (short-subunit alcohol dehydrogenase family)
MIFQEIGLKGHFKKNNNNFMKKKYLIFSISSDFGIALANNWLENGHVVIGTYRNYSERIKELELKGAILFKCDLSSNSEIDKVCINICNNHEWDVLCIAPATLEPVGEFIKISFDEWEKSVNLNFIAQMRIIYNLIPSRKRESINGPIIILFAGGGTNSATKYYSAYTISKIAQIKMTELLDAEIPDTRFTIIGPGWVNTKIHDATISAGKKNAGENYQKTLDIINNSNESSLEKVVECCNWVVSSSMEVVSGRNFSLVHDTWGSESLNEKLKKDQNLYKLRRFGN